MKHVLQDMGSVDAIAISRVLWSVVTTEIGESGRGFYGQCGCCILQRPTGEQSAIYVPFVQARDPMAQFVKGHPGGPGRPRGSRNVVNQILDQFASSEGKALVRKMVERALEGDRVAARPRGPLAQKSNGRELPRYEQGPMVH